MVLVINTGKTYNCWKNLPFLPNVHQRHKSTTLSLVADSETYASPRIWKKRDFNNPIKKGRGEIFTLSHHIQPRDRSRDPQNGEGCAITNHGCWEVTVSVFFLGEWRSIGSNRLDGFPPFRFLMFCLLSAWITVQLHSTNGVCE